MEILKSPSILIDIFEFVQSKRLEKNKYPKSRFKEWMKNIDVKLEKGTKVLNLAYRDTDKEIILPVLNKISEKYQNYSEDKRFKSISRTLEYLDSQRGIYKIKSLNSLNLAQEYAIEQDLSIINQPIKDSFKTKNSKNEDNKKKDEINKEIINSINIEQIRVDASQKIRFINEFLDYIEENASDFDKLSYLLISEDLESVIDSIPNSKTLAKLDREIIFASTVYTPQNPYLRNLKVKRNSLVKESISQIIGLLKSKKDLNNLKINASKRPKGVLIKYRQLLASAKEDLEVKNRLEKEYRLVSLEKARSKENWDLITKPTLLPNKVSPKRLRIISLGLLIGFLVGSLFSLYKENKKNLVYKFDNLNSLVDWKLIDKLKINKKDKWEEIIKFVSKLIIKDRNFSKCYFLIIGDIDTKLIDNIFDNLSRFNEGYKFNKNYNLADLKDDDFVIPLVQIDKTTKVEIQETYDKIKFQKILVKGFILIE